MPGFYQSRKPLVYLLLLFKALSSKMGNNLSYIYIHHRRIKIHPSMLMNFVFIFVFFITGSHGHTCISDVE